MSEPSKNTKTFIKNNKNTKVWHKFSHVLILGHQGPIL